jgi:hypothetical protein
MNYTRSFAKIAILPESEKEKVLKALAAELGYILHPKSRTFYFFGREYILAQVSEAQPLSSTQLSLFPVSTNETLGN